MPLHSYALVGLCVVICINAEAASGEGKTTCQAGQICPTTGSSMLQTTHLQEKSELDLQKEAPEPRDDEAEFALSEVITDQDADGGRPRLSGECRDIDDNCGTKWKDRCDEEKVIWRCRKTCNLCDLCMDWAKNCATKWKNKCSQSNAQLICPQTCGVCSSATSVPTSAPTQVTTTAARPECEEKKLDGAHYYYKNLPQMPKGDEPSIEACLAKCNGCWGLTYNMNYQKCYIYPVPQMAGDPVKLSPNEDIGLRTYLCQFTSEITPEPTPEPTSLQFPCQVTFTDSWGKKHENLWGVYNDVDNVIMFFVWTGYSSEMVSFDLQGVKLESRYSPTECTRFNAQELWKTAKKLSGDGYKATVTKLCDP